MRKPKVISSGDYAKSSKKYIQDKIEELLPLFAANIEYYARELASKFTEATRFGISRNESWNTIINVNYSIDESVMNVKHVHLQISVTLDYYHERETFQWFELITEKWMLDPTYVGRVCSLLNENSQELQLIMNGTAKSNQVLTFRERLTQHTLLNR